ncbi:expressed unknown protein [Seminavis robusta]|uniref:Uncharacterized protein n=1 Tax=Seminavis robusta TaxID=568900 RepID=A0A9N8H9Q2_9STRA|nr:expressed unknown protein [Seminavis robusta]|eukprot:Sro123_g059670.1 n/a (319) ;mRNA; r:85014-85970
MEKPSHVDLSASQASLPRPADDESEQGKEKERTDRSTGSATGGPAIAAASSKGPTLTLDPSLFKLSKEERELALEIKESIESLPDLDILSDFMYANMALVGGVEEAVEKAYLMQEVREEYKIQLTYEDGVRSIRDMIKLLPLTFMSYSFDLKQDRSVMVLDCTKFRQTIWRDPKNMEIILRGAFYVSYATFPSLGIVRAGKTDIFECEGFRLGIGMVDVKIGGQITCQTIGAFPANVTTKFYNTSSMANVISAMTKKLIPKEIGSKWEFGCRLPGGGRLDKLYLQPTPEVATERVLSNFCKGLKIRMESEKIFQLEEE